jgi:hypothetical protein
VLASKLSESTTRTKTPVFIAALPLLHFSIKHLKLCFSVQYSAKSKIFSFFKAQDGGSRRNQLRHLTTYSVEKEGMYANI